MKIVLFDDSSRDREHLVRLIEEWKAERDLSDVIFRQFASISEIEFSFQDILFSDVFFLDIMTPESQSTGFSLAERILLKNPQAIIVFTTNSREYMESAFEISAFRYLLKPLQKEKVFAALDRVYNSPGLRLKTKAVFQGIFQQEVVELDRIVYIEAETKDHRAKLHLTDGSSLEISLTEFPFSELTEKLLSPDFVQCRRNVIINMNYVTAFDRHSVYLLHQVQIDIGKTYRADLFNTIVKHSKGMTEK